MWACLTDRVLINSVKSSLSVVAVGVKSYEGMCVVRRWLLLFFSLLTRDFFILRNKGQEKYSPLTFRSTLLCPGLIMNLKTLAVST